MPEQGPTEEEAAVATIGALREAYGRTCTDRQCQCAAELTCDHCLPRVVRAALISVDQITRARHVREAVEGLSDDAALRFGDPGCDDDLRRQESEALDAGCDTGDVAGAIRRSRGARAIAARAALLDALGETHGNHR